MFIFTFIGIVWVSGVSLMIINALARPRVQAHYRAKAQANTTTFDGRGNPVISEEEYARLCHWDNTEVSQD